MRGTDLSSRRAPLSNCKIERSRSSKRAADVRKRMDFAENDAPAPYPGRIRHDQPTACNSHLSKSFIDFLEIRSCGGDRSLTDADDFPVDKGLLRIRGGRSSLLHVRSIDQGGWHSVRAAETDAPVVRRLRFSIGHLIDVIGKLQLRGVDFQSLTESIDTNTAGGGMIFHVMVEMAEFERALISERTIAGIAAARARRKIPGRRRALTEEQCEEVRRALQDGTLPRDIAARFNVHPRTLMRAADRMGIGTAENGGYAD